MHLVRCNVELKASHSTETDHHRNLSQLFIHYLLFAVVLRYTQIVWKAKGFVHSPPHSLSPFLPSFLSLSLSLSCARARKSECIPGRIPMRLHRPRVSRQFAARKFDARNAMPDAYCGDRELIVLELCYSVKLSRLSLLRSLNSDAASLQQRAVHFVSDALVDTSAAHQRCAAAIMSARELAGD